MLVAVEFWYGSAAYVVTTFYRVKVLSHNNNDDKLKVTLILKHFYF